MSSIVTNQHRQLTKGIQFLFESFNSDQIVAPSDFNEEHKMIAETVEQFVINEVNPVREKLEKLEPGLSKKLLIKMGDLGLLSTHMPEYLGGLEMDFITNTLIAEKIGPSGGFSVSYNAHTGIGMLPILYFGTEEQKKKYLPALMTGEHVASYCLTEPSSGSDALAAKTRADLSEDGTHYILNGQKMWISNAGFADIFTVFAQVGGNQFTGFILEKGMAGFTMGEEEKKLGIKASSTRQIFFENVMVPVENVLGKIGKGHLIAFNVLNTGRYKLGVSCLGGIKQVNNQSISYANERHQFKQPISSFGAIKQKIADQAVQTYALESLIYRIAGLMDDWTHKLLEEGTSYGQAKLEAAKEFALECSIVKVLGSEVLDFCVDEAVQIFGGMGYSEEGVIAQAYRDSRINRIFEGTNEINRMLMINLIYKKAMKGELDLTTPALAIQSELNEIKGTQASSEEVISDEENAISRWKKLFLLLLGAAGQKAMMGKLNLKEEQQILMFFADILMGLFSAESLWLRMGKENNPTMTDELKKSILNTHFQSINHTIKVNATDSVASMISQKNQSYFVNAIDQFCNYPLQNVAECKRIIANQLIKDGEYKW